MTIDKSVTAPSPNLKVVGTRPIRHDGLDKVTGRAKYGADISLPQMLYAKVLRSPHAHARINSIETRRAEALPGVQAVVTSADFPLLADRPIDFAEIRGNARMLGENILARGKTLYKGHAVAAVAALDPHIAEQALELIDVDYQPLPTVLTYEDAMKEDAPLLHEQLTTRRTAAFKERGADNNTPSNIASRMQFQHGDLEDGFRQAEVTVEREFRTQSVHQGYIEPHASTASWMPNGHVTVWTSTQGPFSVRSQTALILGIPESRVKIVPMEIGGGFGGKLDAWLDPVVAMLSKKSGRPVKLVMTRKEVFEATGPTSATFLRAKIGATRDGKITAASLLLIYEAGAFPGSPVGEAALTSFAFYKIENLLVDGYDVVVNKPRAAAYRAPGAPLSAFAVESSIDELAAKLGMDPLEFRLKNVASEGDRMPSGIPHTRFGGVELLEAMRSHPHYRNRVNGPNRGRAVSVGFWFNASMPSSATVNVNADGTISLITGSVDIGGSRAAIAMQAAEVLGLAAHDVTPSVADTDSVGWTGVTGGSRTAVDTGRAAIFAAEEVKRRMVQRAAMLWEVQPEDVVFEEGAFRCLKEPAQQLTFKELAQQLLRSGGPISVSATPSPARVAPAVAGNIVDVEVDPETGKVSILRFTVFQDVGRAAHPSYVEGQMQGGSVQGIGWALSEEYFYTPDGSLANPTFLDYRMVTALDVPRIETVLLEVPNPAHPFGLRGVGEVSIVPPMAAVANAIYDAIGVRLTQLPMSPGTVLEAMKQTSMKG